MTDLDVETRGRLEAASRRREAVLVGALNAVAVSRTNAARASVALQAAVAARSTILSADTPTGPGNDGWDRRPDDVAGTADGQYLGLSACRSGRSPAEQHDGQDDREDELEGRDWLR